ncbi:adenylate/guanylate cyclase domain-containing protein [Minwuia sp.]|uniref:adenylate/guanylate cyclase domain-containing protein n=1 Tax=Minwuia sp. TaxID=2493630 RepID=UPI003A923779
MADQPENSFAAYHALLDIYGRETSEKTRREIENDIWTRFGRECAVFVLDMSGFSRLTESHGAVHYLSMVRRMNLTLTDIVRRNDGTLIKFEADNCFAIFPTIRDAVQCAISANMHFEGTNKLTSDAFDIDICIGISFGEILLIEERDFFGDAVNRAARLGEDIAGPGEILVDAELADQLVRFRHEPVVRETGKGRVDAIRISY